MGYVIWPSAARFSQESNRQGPTSAPRACTLSMAASRVGRPDPSSARPGEAGWRALGGGTTSFWLSFHLALLGLSGAHWLDDPSELSCKDSTQQYPVDD